ncbi:MAG: MBOAT family protein, partial [Actinobacteria bacterium]|nr:MBOAT family protein [Actinomycetota bacterium]
MLLNSHSFLLVFLPVVVALYWLTPHGRPRLVLLVGASLFFYGLWDWRYVPLLLTTTLVDWVAGRLLAGSTAEGASRRRKLVLAA